MEGSLIDDKREKHSISKSEIHSIFPTLPYLVNLIVRDKKSIIVVLSVVIVSEESWTN